MSFPARKVFKRDRRRRLNDILVYEFLEDELDDQTPTECKLPWVAHGTGIQANHLSRPLKNLVAWGYVVDHRTEKQKRANEPWLLTLVRVWPRQAA